MTSGKPPTTQLSHLEKRGKSRIDMLDKCDKACKAWDSHWSPLAGFYFSEGGEVPSSFWDGRVWVHGRVPLRRDI